MILDIYIAMEESYKNGYRKGCEDTRKELEAELKDERYRHDRYVDFELAEAEELRKAREELAFTRKFIHEHGLEFELASEWAKQLERKELI